MSIREVDAMLLQIYNEVGDLGDYKPEYGTSAEQQYGWNCCVAQVQKLIAHTMHNPPEGSLE